MPNLATRLLAGIVGCIPMRRSERKRALQYRLTRSPEAVLETYAVPESMKKDAIPEMKRALSRYGMYYEEFCLYGLYEKNKSHPSSFLTEVNRYDYFRRLNVRRDVSFYHDKYRVYQVYRPFYRREAVPLRSKADLAVFRDFAARHPVFVIKPLSASCGSGVAVIRTADYPSVGELFSESLRKGHQMAEELILQNPVLSAFHPASVNTVRFVTVVTGNNRTGYTVHPFYPFLRVGRGASRVDNGGAGGILIPVDAETGALASSGRDETGRYYAIHPDTGVSFRGRILPNWKEAVSLAVSLALIRPENRLVSWDLAATPTGWVMVEANCGGQFVGQQLWDQRGKKDELDRILSENLPEND